MKIKNPIDWVLGLFTNDRHDFDLNHPEEVIIGLPETASITGIKQYKYTRFRCVKCGQTLAWDRRQMENLPSIMKYGCKRSK